MKKIFSFILLALVGISLIFNNSSADETRTIKHNFKAYTADAAVAQSKTIFRISGYATGSNAVFGIYNVGTLGGASTDNVVIEGGEATSGDPIEPINFGEEGLPLDSGSTVIVSNCTIVIEYI